MMDRTMLSRSPLLRTDPVRLLMIWTGVETLFHERQAARRVFVIHFLALYMWSQWASLFPVQRLSTESKQKLGGTLLSTPGSGPGRGPSFSICDSRPGSP